jgi:hypothetical protein
VEIGSDTVFERGTRIEMPRLSDFKQSGNNIEYGSNETFVACPNGLQSPFVPGSEVQIALMQ